MGLMTSMMAGQQEPVNDMEEDDMEAEDSSGGEAVPPELAAEVVKALSNPKLKESILQAGQSKDPASALMGIAYGMIEALDEKAKGQIPPQAMPGIAMEIVDMLTELSGGDDDLKAQVLKALVEQSTKMGEQFLSNQRGGAQQQMPPGVQ